MSDFAASREASKDSPGRQGSKASIVVDMTGERQNSKDAVSRRRSSLGRGVGQSLGDVAAEKEASKPAFLKAVLNPILEQMALKYFEVGDETAHLSQSYEDLVKQYIEWLQTKEDLPPPDEIDSTEPTKEELARLKEQNRELTRKIEEINKIEGQSGGGKLQNMVRRMSNARRFSKSLARGPSK